MASDRNRLKESSISVLTLFTSAGTLVCCALPILLVTLGMGAAVANLTSSAPWLVSLSEHKEGVFVLSFLMLLLCAWFIYRPGRACPGDPELARVCARMDKLNRWIYWASVAVWVVGFFSAFLLWPLTEWLNAETTRRTIMTEQATGRRLLACAAASLITLASTTIRAEGHGPAFALATPTLGKGQWSSDTSVMSFKTEEDTSYMLRKMIGYGINADLQAIFTLPLVRGGDRLMDMPRTRPGAMMGSGRDVEVSLLWRFDREAPAIGTRRESTLILSAAAPFEDVRGHVKVGPSTHIGAVTGFASREIYWWLGGGYHRYFEKDQDRLGDLTYLSAAFAWRPPIFQQDYPKPDWRIFVEALAEHAGKNTVKDIEQANSGGDKLLAGPSVLGLFGPWGVTAGVLFPLAQDLNGDQEASEERFRAKAVLTYWF